MWDICYTHRKRGDFYHNTAILLGKPFPPVNTTGQTSSNSHAVWVKRIFPGSIFHQLPTTGMYDGQEEEIVRNKLKTCSCLLSLVPYSFDTKLLGSKSWCLCWMEREDGSKKYASNIACPEGGETESHWVLARKFRHSFIHDHLKHVQCGIYKEFHIFPNDFHWSSNPIRKFLILDLYCVIIIASHAGKYFQILLKGWEFNGGLIVLTEIHGTLQCFILTCNILLDWLQLQHNIRNLIDFLLLFF